MLRAITGVVPLENYQLLLTFSGGEFRVFDVSPYLEKGAFAPLREKAIFDSVRISFDTVAWPNGADFCPEMLYANSRAVTRSSLTTATVLLVALAIGAASLPGPVLLTNPDNPVRPNSLLLDDAADGFVVVDGVQFVPVDIADLERDGTLNAGFATAARLDSTADDRNARAAAVAVSPLTKEVPGRLTAPPSTEPVHLAHDVKACAVRAAREGCTVLLVQHNRHLGGMLSNGLMQWDALYGGPRAPLMTELLGNIERDAFAHFGQDSRNHQLLRT
jgi:hypothetical protein